MLKIYIKEIDNNAIIDETKIPDILKKHLAKKKSPSSSINAWMLLVEALNKEGYDLKTLDLTFSKNGKPLTKEICFSISHSGSFCAVLLSEDNVGLDIEELKDLSNLDLLIDKLFCTKLNENISKLDAFYQAFCSFEAKLKHDDQLLGYPKKRLRLDNGAKSLKLKLGKKELWLSYYTFNKEDVEIINLTSK